MITRNELNSRWWHRGFKVIFISTFLVVQIIGFRIAWSVSKEQIAIINPARTTYDTQYHASVADYQSRLETAQNKYFAAHPDVLQSEVRSDPFFSIFRPLPPGYPTPAWPSYNPPQAHLLEDKYNTTEKIGLIILSFLVVDVLFLLIKKTYFYIVIGENIFHSHHRYL